jgi:UPF0716 family protein affecting phage T7 exclusion
VNLTRSHEWTARRLLAYGAGILAESETLDVEQHLRSCTECRTRLAAIRPPAGSDPRHLPASLIATWPRSSRLLVGADRDLVVRHLHQCELCRASLEFVGYSEVLAPPQHAVPSHWARLGRRWTAWAWAVGVIGAVAGAVRVVAGEPGFLTEEQYGLSLLDPRGRAAAAAKVTFETAVDSLARSGLRLPEPGYRGHALDVGVVTSISGLVLVLPPALQPPTPEIGVRNMTITLLREEQEVGSHQGRFYALGDAIRLRPEDRLEAGLYELRFSLAPADSAGKPLEFAYRLRVR